MVYYPVGVGVHCHGPLLLRRGPPAATSAPLQLQLQSRPHTSSARRPPRRRPDDDGDGFLTLDLDQFEGDDEDEEVSSPWEGALVYRRDAAAQHVEYATTLERLGLAGLSSPHSRARAAAMGILRPSTKTKLPETSTPIPANKKNKTESCQEELEERIISLVASLFGIQTRVKAEAERFESLDLDDLEMDDNEKYNRKLEAGLYTLQLVALILGHIWLSGNSQMRTRIELLLRQNKLTKDDVKDILQEYHNNIGDLDGTEEKERAQGRTKEIIAAL